MTAQENLEELIRMRDEGLRCLAVASHGSEETELTKWQNCIGRIEAMITRHRGDDLV